MENSGHFESRQGKLFKESKEQQNPKSEQGAHLKSPWRFAFLLLALAAACKLLEKIVAVFLYLSLQGEAAAVSEAASIGIIGGADGPTAIFVTYSVPAVLQLVIPALLVAAGVFGYLRLKRCKRND